MTSLKFPLELSGLLVTHDIVWDVQQDDNTSLSHCVNSKTGYIGICITYTDILNRSIEYLSIFRYIYLSICL